MERSSFSYETLLSTLSVRKRSADDDKRLDSTRNFGANYFDISYAVGKKTRIALI